MYLGDPSDSGKIHSDVSARWRQGDSDVINGMKRFADITDQARCILTLNLMFLHNFLETHSRSCVLTTSHLEWEVLFDKYDCSFLYLEYSRIKNT